MPEHDYTTKGCGKFVIMQCKQEIFQGITVAEFVKSLGLLQTKIEYDEGARFVQFFWSDNLDHNLVNIVLGVLCNDFCDWVEFTKHDCFLSDDQQAT